MHRRTDILVWMFVPRQCYRVICKASKQHKMQKQFSKGIKNLDNRNGMETLQLSTCKAACCATFPCRERGFVNLASCCSQQPLLLNHHSHKHSDTSCSSSHNSSSSRCRQKWQQGPLCPATCSLMLGSKQLPMGVQLLAQLQVSHS